jgi:hypothetical protein
MLLPRDNTTPQSKLEKVRLEGCYRCYKKDFEITDNKLVCLKCGYNYWIEPDKSDGLYRSYVISEESIIGKEADASKWNLEKSNRF